MTPVERTGTAQALVAGLVERLTARLTADGAPPRLVVGLTGAPGSGKSTLSERIGTELAARGLLAGCVPMDGFHMSNAVLAELDRHGRKGSPDTFDVAGYLAALDRVGGLDGFGLPAEVLVPVYRRDLHEPVAAGRIVTGPGAVITEGNYLALETRGWGAVRERIDLLLPTRVTRFELVDNHHPIMRTDVITLEITGPFVGCQGSHSLWEEVEPSVLASHLKRFEGQDLLAVESGPGWLHLDFTDGWIRVVAAVNDYSSWNDSWKMTLPEITWTGTD